MVAVVGIARVGDATARRARADAAADLVALAGAVGGPDGAAEVARAMRTAVVAFEGGDDPPVVVTVERDGVVSRAAAVGAPGPVASPGPGGPVAADPPR